MSIKNAKYNSLGIGVDYRSVYGSIPRELYLAFLTPLLDIEMTVSGNNFSPGKAGYTRLLSGTGLINQKTTRLNENIVPE